MAGEDNLDFEGMAEEAPEEPEGKKQKKERKPMSPLVRYLLLSSASMVIVFFTVYLAVSKMEEKRRAEAAIAQAEADSLAALADTLEVVEPPIDSVEVAVVDSVQTDSLDALAAENLRRAERTRLIEQMAYFRDQLSQKQSQLRELSAVAEERTGLQQEILELKSEIYDSQKELEFYKETLPERVADEVVSRQTAAATPPVSVAQGNAATQQRGGTASRTQTTTAPAGAGIRKLAKMYETMKPQEAAPILAELKIDETIEIIKRMKPRNSAKVLAKMDRELAAKITSLIGKE